MTKKILILGRSGQVASNLVQLYSRDLDTNVIAIDREDIDFTEPKTVYKKLQALSFKPDVIINGAAYTAVDKAEEERKLCEDINYTSIVEVARYAKAIDALLIHYSTDYVFDGEGEKSYEETNTRNLKPLNFYGQTKLDSEKAITNYNGKHIILRTSWVYNDIGKNFVHTILNLSKEREELNIVDDQIGSPTYAPDLAQATIDIINKYEEGKDGIYHAVPKQQISWFDFAVLILETALKMGHKCKTQKINPIITAQFPSKAKRPHNSRLSVAKLEKEFGVVMPKIDDSVRHCLSKILQANW